MSWVVWGGGNKFSGLPKLRNRIGTAMEPQSAPKVRRYFDLEYKSKGKRQRKSDHVIMW